MNSAQFIKTSGQSAQSGKFQLNPSVLLNVLVMFALIMLVFPQLTAKLSLLTGTLPKIEKIIGSIPAGQPFSVWDRTVFYKVQLPAKRLRLKDSGLSYGQFSGIPSKNNKPLNSTDDPLASLDRVLPLHYSEAQIATERRAYQQVLRWQACVDTITKDYSRVNTETLLAIIKAETQGQTGRQISNQRAIGLTQIKYQGAWAFLWDALFRKYTGAEGKKKIDYYNVLKRERYGKQLERIRNHLDENNVLIIPKDTSDLSLRMARSQSWERLKRYLNKIYQPDEYQVAVDISAMYVDHLIFLMRDYGQKIEDIQKQIDTSRKKGLNRIQFKGATQNIWARIKKSAPKGPIVAHLGAISKHVTDAKTNFAAYNVGPTQVIDWIEKGRDLPEYAQRYAAKVEKHKRVFEEICLTGDRMVAELEAI